MFWCFRRLRQLVITNHSCSLIMDASFLYFVGKWNRGFFGNTSFAKKHNNFKKKRNNFKIQIFREIRNFRHRIGAPGARPVLRLRPALPGKQPRKPRCTNSATPQTSKRKTRSLERAARPSWRLGTHTGVWYHPPAVTDRGWVRLRGQRPSERARFCSLAFSRMNEGGNWLKTCNVPRVHQHEYGPKPRHQPLANSLAYQEGLRR